ncbi:hypothetical protein [Pseudarthrobacter sp. 1C304]|uniref:hypothetical protein n=1 Tax=Pseudarthrobacter sp. 1C304 TaxID=3457438 RepID=UPI003FCFDC48
MTEPHHPAETDPAGPDPAEPDAGGAARATWPEAPAGADAGTGTRDSAVDVLLDRLGELPELPVARHGEVYAGLHDDLLEALNESATTTPSGGQHE